MARILGVDYGERRVGFAVSDPTGCLSTPLMTVTVASVEEAVDAVRQALRRAAAERVVVGMPLNMNGSKGPAAEAVEHFAERIRAALGVPVEFWDERLSTGLVERMLVEEANLSRGRRRAVRDKLAAQVILQGYLDRAGGAAGEAEW